MSRIMLVVTEGNNDYDSLYKYLTITNTEGKIVPYEASTLTELDRQVESMLNGKYAKKDFIIVQAYEYGIDADFVKNEITSEPSDENQTETE